MALYPIGYNAVKILIDLANKLRTRPLTKSRLRETALNLPAH
jgi:hypothetical protein